MWTQEFAQELTSGNIDEAQNLKLAHLPKSLFKYRALDEKSRKYSLDILKKDVLWVSSANNFNDPYDCFHTLSLYKLIAGRWLNDKEKLKKFTIEKCKVLTQSEVEKPNSIEELGKLILSKDKDIPPERHDEIIKDMKDAGNEIFKDYHINKFRDIVQKNMAICSLSEKNSSIVMWRYYANNHNGFCLEYGLDDMKKFNHKLITPLYPVIYTENLLDGTQYFMDENNSNLPYFNVICAIHKSKEWSYEQEWRIVLPIGEKNSNFPLKMPKPKAIYIGSETSEEDKKILNDIAKKKNIEAFVMKICPTAYHLESERIK